MNILLFIFRLVHRFVDIDPQEFPKIQQEAKDWYNEIRIDEEVPKKDVRWYMKTYAEKWYVKLGLAVFYIFAVKSIQEWMNPQEEEPEDRSKF